jgi:hypothetical protein
MTRVVDFDHWQQKRRAMLPLQTEILARREHHSHRPRTDDERQAVIDGVRALMAERLSSGEWTWVGPRELVIAEPPRALGGQQTKGTPRERRPAL